MAAASAKTFGDYVREIRLQLSQTQSEFAQSVGVEQATVSRWEKGTSIPTVDKYKAVINYAEKSGIDTTDYYSMLGNTPEIAESNLKFIRDNIPIIGEIRSDCTLSRYEEGELYQVVIPPSNAVQTTQAFHSPFPRGLYLKDRSCTCFFNDNKSPIISRSMSCLALICDQDGTVKLGSIIEKIRKNTYAVLLANGKSMESMQLVWAEKITWIIL